MKPPEFDVAAAHRFFAADCFNRAWDLIEKPERTADEDRLMVALSGASIFHWLNRPDCTDRNRSIGYWQASRIHALLGHATEAARHAATCLGYSGDLAPFYLGHAHEAAARAALLAKDSARARDHLAKAEVLAERVIEKDDRDRLAAELAELRRAAGDVT